MRRLIFLGLILVVNLGLAATKQMAVLADIHFNPFADCRSSKNCPLINKLNDENADQWPKILAQFSSNTLPVVRQETNYTLFTSLLTQLQQQKPEMVLILGDFLAHRYRSLYLKYAHDHNRDHYDRFVFNTMAYLTTAIQQALPDHANIYSVIGNNDSLGGKDCAYPDYCVITDGVFYQILAKQWSNLLSNPDNKNQLLTDFPHAGYYEIVLPDTRNHILILNTVLFSNKALGPDIDITAQQQLQWLQLKLQTIAAANEKTWIIFHIPPGIDAYSTAKNFFGGAIAFWNNDDTKKFINLIHQYNSSITGILSGHLHMDGFLILDMKSHHVIVDTFVASISPIFGNNPSFKIYSYDDHEFNLHNFSTYYLDLQNKATQWKQEYNFSNTYQSDSGLYQGYEKITADKHNPYSANYIRFYSVNTQSQPINHGKWNYYWCAISYLDQNPYQNCRKKNKS